MSRPRTIKTHLPVHLLPDDVWNVKPKIIYISRNSKDVAVSYYHFYKDFCHSPIGFEGFMEAFMQDRILFSPFREHRLDYWNLPDYENILYVTYEEVMKDFAVAVKKVSEFLGKNVSDENLERIREHLRFDTMKRKSRFILRGQVGVYVDTLISENESCNNQGLLKRINEYAQEDKVTTT